jgi:hypothetical protein
MKPCYILKVWIEAEHCVVLDTQHCKVKGPGQYSQYMGRAGGSNSNRGKIFFWPPKCPDQHGDHPDSYLAGTRGKAAEA